MTRARTLFTALALALLAVAAEAFMSAPAALDPDLSSRSPPIGDQTLARVAAFDGGWWMVWVDDRTAPGTTDVYGARVLPNLSVVPPSGAPLIGHSGPKDRASTACESNVCIVAWGEGNSVLAQRFTTDAVPLDSSPLVLTTTFKADRTDVAFAPPGFLVAWASGGPVLGAIVPLSGAPVTTTLASQGASFRVKASVAAGPADWLVTWADFTGLYAAHVDSTGTAGLPQLIAFGLPPTSIRAAWNGSGWTLIWVNAGNNLDTRRVDAAGVPISPVTLAVDAGAGAGKELTLTPAGAGLLVAHNRTFSPTGVFATPLDLNGAPTGPTQAISATLSDNAWSWLATGPNGTLIAWQDLASVADFDLFAQTVSAGGSPSGPMATLAPLPRGHRLPSIAASPGGFLVTWLDNTHAADGGGVSLTGAGVGFDALPAGAPFTLDGAPGRRGPSAAIWLGDRWGVTWSSVDNVFSGNPKVLFATVAPPAAVSAPVSLAPPNSCCFGQPSWLAAGPWAWAVFPGYDGVATRAYGFRVAPDGGVLDRPAVIFSPMTAMLSVSAAWASASNVMLLAWQEPQIRAQRFDVMGQPLGAAVDVSTGSMYPVDPVVASDGHDFLVAWQGTFGPFAVIVGGASGAVVGAPVQLEPYTLPKLDNSLAVAFDGQRYRVAVTSEDADGGLNVNVHALDVTGQPTGAVDALPAAFEQSEPALAVGTPGRVGLVVLDSSTGVSRSVMRMLAEVPQGAPCAGSAECVAGVCLGGVCCAPFADGGGGCTADAGSDGGAGDAGVDGGAGDAGAADAGRLDAGPEDAGSPEPLRPLALGCGCTSSADGFGLALLAALARRRGARPRAPRGRACRARCR